MDWRLGFRAVAFYALLILPWPGLEQGFGDFYRECANLVAAGLAILVAAERVEGKPHGHDTKFIVYLRLATPHSGGMGQIWYGSSRRHSYMQFALFFAATLALRMSLRRRICALVAGGTMLTGMVALTLVSSYLSWGADMSTMGSEARQFFDGRVFRVFSDAVTSGDWFIPPLLIWAGVAVPFGFHPIPEVSGTTTYEQHRGGSTG